MPIQRTSFEKAVKLTVCAQNSHSRSHGNRVFTKLSMVASLRLFACATAPIFWVLLQRTQFSARVVCRLLRTEVEQG